MGEAGGQRRARRPGSGILVDTECWGEKPRMHAGAVAEVTGEHVQFRRPGPDNPRRPRVLVQGGTVHQFRRGQTHKTKPQPDTPYQLSDMASSGSDRALAISAVGGASE